MTGAAFLLQLGGRNDEAKAIRASAQPAVDGHKPTVVELRQRDVLGVVGFRPAKVLDDQHAQWDSRERRTAAATLGIGSPVSVSPQGRNRQGRSAAGGPPARGWCPEPRRRCGSSRPARRRRPQPRSNVNRVTAPSDAAGDLGVGPGQTRPDQASSRPGIGSIGSSPWISSNPSRSLRSRGRPASRLKPTMLLRPAI